MGPQVCNAIVEFETVPEAMKLGIVRPIYKGGGCDPLDTNSYHGITISSVLSKTLELLLLGHFQEFLSELQFPHLNQTGFVKRTSCIDAIFSSYELTSCLTRGGDTAYICFFFIYRKHLTQFNIQSFSIECLAVLLMGRLGGCLTLGILSQNVEWKWMVSSPRLFAWKEVSCRDLFCHPLSF